jgi:hypothetical protein
MTGRHWYSMRKPTDAPDDIKAVSPATAWAVGWNAAVEAYIAEVSELARREGLRP